MLHPNVLQDRSTDATHEYGISRIGRNFNFIYAIVISMSADHVHFFFHLRDQIKLYHWQTRVYARHIATDQILQRIEKNIDSFVEVYIGKYGRPKLTGAKATITLHNLTEAGATRLIKAAIKMLLGPITRSLRAGVDADLLTLRDDMVADLNQLLYLFTLH